MERWTIPNAISVVRLLLVPLLVLLALREQRVIFLVVLGIQMFSDCIDGPIARRLNQVSDFGAQLDSWADFGMYVALPVCGVWLWPEVMKTQHPYVTVVLISYAAPIAAAVVKFGRLPSIHTYGAKVAAVCIGLSAFVMFAFGILAPFRLCAPLAVVTALDELAVITILRNWRANVRSVWHAMDMRRKEMDTGKPGDTV